MELRVRPIPCNIFTRGQNLERYIAQHIKHIPDGSIVVITSKIVALSQRRTVDISEQKDDWIKKESDYAIKTKWCYLTLKEGHWCPNAGIDESNAPHGGLILWPKNSFAVAQRVRQKLLRTYRRKKLGVLVTDSHLSPLRAGVTGVALGYAGFKGLRDYRGTPDLFDRSMKMTQTNVADTLASAAVLMMGEGSERCPLALITHAPVAFIGRVDRSELHMDPAEDLYSPFFTHLHKAKNGGTERRGDTLGHLCYPKSI